MDKLIALTLVAFLAGPVPIVVGYGGLNSVKEAHLASSYRVVGEDMIVLDNPGNETMTAPWHIARRCLDHRGSLPREWSVGSTGTIQIGTNYFGDPICEVKAD
jgi:hypothetical protein